MKPEHLKIETVDPLGSGGQSVGRITTEVRVTHIPTGISATCDTGRSQLRSKKVAIAMVEWGLCELGWKE